MRAPPSASCARPLASALDRREPRLMARTCAAGSRGAIALARDVGAPLIATNDALMHAPERRALADVLACIREKTTLEAAGRLTQANAERHLKDPREMARLFAEAPEAIAETIRFLDGLAFSLDELSHCYPEELREGYATAQEALEAFVLEGRGNALSRGRSGTHAEALTHELKLIASLDYAPYFLTVHDIVRFARSKGILCQGRGSAANSAVCFCLGITEVDPVALSTSCSSASSRPSATSLPTSTSTSSTSGARR